MNKETKLRGTSGVPNLKFYRLRVNQNHFGHEGSALWCGTL